jgi:hypothetical protein
VLEDIIHAGRRTEIRGQEAEVRGQRTEVRGQMADVRGQKAAYGRQEAEGGRRKAEGLKIGVRRLDPPGGRQKIPRRGSIVPDVSF